MKRLLLVHNLVHGQSVVHELDDKDFAVELVEGEADAIFAVLIDHYGDKAELFAALWSSRGPASESEPAETILGSASPGDGKREVLSYVENGMVGWRLF